MSASKDGSFIDGSSFPNDAALANAPPSSSTYMYGSQNITEFSFFNDSHSDDTQFDIRSAGLSSTLPSPTKLDFTPKKAHSDPVPQEHAGRVREPVNNNNELNPRVEPEKDSDLIDSVRITDSNAEEFVEYLLAHEDLVKALDDYSEAIGSVPFFPEDEVVPPAAQEPSIAVPVPANTVKFHSVESVLQATGAIPDASSEIHGNKNDVVSPEKKVEKTTRPLKRGSTKKAAQLREQKITPTISKRAERRKPRTYSQAVPSQHCHICSRRPTETSPHAVCGNLLKGRCRKTICTKCFHQFRWDLKAAREAAPGTWECPHCRGECPQRAQCVIYNRTSDRRRMKLINHRKRKDTDGSAIASDPKELTKAMPATQAANQSQKESRVQSPDSGETTPKRRVTKGNNSSGSRGCAFRMQSSNSKMAAHQKGNKKPTMRSTLPFPPLSSIAEFQVEDDAISPNTTPHPKVETSCASLRNEYAVDLPVEMTPYQLRHPIPVPHHMLQSTNNELYGGVLAEPSVQQDTSTLNDVFNSVALPEEILDVNTETRTAGQLELEHGNGEEGLDIELDFPGINDSPQIRTEPEDAGGAGGGMWGDEELKFEELGGNDFGFSENGLGLDLV